MSNPSPTLPNNPLTSARGDLRNYGGASGNAGYCIFESLTTEPKDSENDMWNMYLDEVNEDDQQIANAWREGADGVLVFVSLNLQSPCSSQ
jgi:hypothetical protein